MCVLWCPIRNFAIFPSSSHFLPIRLARAPARLHVHIGKFRVGEAVRFPACRGTLQHVFRNKQASVGPPQIDGKMRTKVEEW